MSTSRPPSDAPPPDPERAYEPDARPVDAARGGAAEELASREPVTPEAYRAVMRHWPSGVTVITMRDGEQDHGMTASAFTSVSLSPPMVLVVIDRRWRSHDLIEEGGAFCVNILADDQARWSDRFAGRHGEMPDRFVDVPVTRAVTGAPCLRESVAWLDCRVAQSHRAGDHTVFIGCVLASSHREGASSPLLYHDGAYRRLEDAGV